jgi:hypothetical protein
MIIDTREEFAYQQVAYARISDAKGQVLNDHLQQEDNVILIGPPGAGKQCWHKDSHLYFHL